MSKPIISQNPINTCFAQKKSTALCSESVPMWSLECQHLAFDSNISHENCAKVLWFAWNNGKQQVCLSKNRGVPPQIIHFDRIFHEINHPFWDTPIFGNIHVYFSLHTTRVGSVSSTSLSYPPYFCGPDFMFFLRRSAHSAMPKTIATATSRGCSLSICSFLFPHSQKANAMPTNIKRHS